MKKFDVLVRDDVNDRYYSTQVQAENKANVVKYALDHLVILDKVERENMSIVDIKRVTQHI